MCLFEEARKGGAGVIGMPTRGVGSSTIEVRFQMNHPMDPNYSAIVCVPEVIFSTTPSLTITF
jgi:hypothetical protein